MVTPSTAPGRTKSPSKSKGFKAGSLGVSVK
jgi:hypothetical protein